MLVDDVEDQPLLGALEQAAAAAAAVAAAVRLCEAAAKAAVAIDRACYQSQPATKQADLVFSLNAYDPMSCW
jgi:hypothetical protein